MSVVITYPGVAVVERESGSRSITAVSTSVAMFIGMTSRGRLNTPTRVLSFTEYERVYGTDVTQGEMTHQVRQFFLNGGKTAWIVRVANGAASAAVTLHAEDSTDVLTLTALDAGVDGNNLRAEVDYNTSSPERLFNLRLYRRVVDTLGNVTENEVESFTELSMDPGSGRFVESVLNSQSALVEAGVVVASLPGTLGTVDAALPGRSRSGLVFQGAAGDPSLAQAALSARVTATANRIRISVDGQPAVEVTLPTGADEAAIETAINTRLLSEGQTGSVSASFAEDTLDSNNAHTLEITSDGGQVIISAAQSNDLAAVLQLGVAQGGIEVDRFSAVRPAPSGLCARLHATGNDLSRLTAFGRVAQDNVVDFTLIDADNLGGISGAVSLPGGTDSMYVGNVFPLTGLNTDLAGSLLNVVDNLSMIANAISGTSISPTETVGDRWDVSVHGWRLVLTPRFGTSDADLTASLDATDGGGGYSIANAGEIFEAAANPLNVAAYTVGQTGGLGGGGVFQTASVGGDNGAFPIITDYEGVFATIRRDVDIFNLMVLPRAVGQADTDRQDLWGVASAFCQERRAFLLVDPPSDAGAWGDVNEVTDAGTGIASRRIGVTTDHARFTGRAWSSRPNPGPQRSTRPAASRASWLGPMPTVASPRRRQVWKRRSVGCAGSSTGSATMKTV